MIADDEARPAAKIMPAAYSGQQQAATKQAAQPGLAKGLRCG
jgi:hypothetical protein